MTSSTSHARLVKIHRPPTLAQIACFLVPLAMTAPLLMPLETIRCRRPLATTARLLMPLPTSPRLQSPLVLPHDSRAQPATPPPCWNSTQHPH